MNSLGGILLLFVVAIAVLMGVVYAGSQTPSTSIQDTYGTGTSGAVNISQNNTVNLTAQGVHIGGTTILFVAAIALLTIMVTMGVVMFRKKGGVGRGF